MRSMAGRWSDQDIAASLNRMGMPTGQGKTWTAHRVSSVRRVRGIHGYRSAEKNGEWLTLRDAAAKLSVSHHQIRSSRPASSRASRSCRTPHIRFVRSTSQVSGSLLRSSKKVARVGSIPKDRTQCLQILEEEVQNESVIAIPRNSRSAALLLMQMRPSSRKRVNASMRLSM
jgi:hypothetical protein